MAERCACSLAACALAGATARVGCTGCISLIPVWRIRVDGRTRQNWAWYGKSQQTHAPLAPLIDTSTSTLLISSSLTLTNSPLAAMDIQHWAGVSHALQTIAAASLVFAACVYLPRLNFKAQLAKLPPLDYEGGINSRTAFLQSAKKMYLAGYQQVGCVSACEPTLEADWSPVQRSCLPHGRHRRYERVKTRSMGQSVLIRAL
jgi:hypothetical protein